MKPRKFNFISVRQMTEKKKPHVPTCSFNLQTGMLAFSAHNHNADEYRGKFVKLYADPSKTTVGWTFLDREPLEKMDDYTQIKDVKGTNKLYIPRKLIHMLNLDPRFRYVNLEIGTYIDNALLGHERPIYYVTFVGTAKKEKE